MKPSLKAVSLVLWLALFTAHPGAADGTNADETLSPYFFVENGDPPVDQVPLEGHQRRRP